MNKLLLAVFLALMIFTSCRKEVQKDNEKLFLPGKNSISSISTTSYTTFERPQGLYLTSSFLTILGNTTKEDSLITWSLINSINKFSYYQINTILSSSTLKSQLASFIIKAKDEGIEDHVAIMASDSTFTLIKNYNAAQSANSKFTSIQIEDEWWQSSRTVSDYYDAVDLLKSMKTWGGNQSPYVSVDLYFGRFNNIPGTDAQAADTLIKYSDRVLIANELSDPITSFYPTYLQNRVSAFSDAADRANRFYPIVIIFYPGQAPNYFSSNTFKGAFTNFTGRSWDNLIRSDDTVHGYQLFSYAEAKAIRPLPHYVTFKVNNSPSKPISGQIRIYDSTNTLIDMKTFLANVNTLTSMKQLPTWRMEVDATNSGTVRYVMEVYIKGNFIKAYTINAGATKTIMVVPSPSGLHTLQGNVTLTFYPG